MTSMTRKPPADADQVTKLADKLMESEELSAVMKLLADTTDDDGDGQQVGLDGDTTVKALIQASLNKALAAEMDSHLGYHHGDRSAKTGTNHRNGSYPKTVDTSLGPVDVNIPRDRDGSFTPRMVPKGSRRLGGLDDMIISLYAGGMTIRDIQHHLAMTVGTDLSHETISNITDAVLEEVMVWQNRQLDAFYPVIYLDAIRVKIRDNGRVVNKAAYLAVGVDMDGFKRVLGIWIQSTEGASFWAYVCAELANRGVEDVLIVCCDGLKGLPEAVEATWPDSMVQTCVVHLIRAANRWVSHKDRKSVSRALKAVYTAPDETTAQVALEEFAGSDLGRRYPQAVAVWENAWEQFIPFLQFPPMLRRVIYTTNSIESLNSELLKATRNRVQFTNDESAVKTLWLMICNIEDKRAIKREKNKTKKTKEPSAGRLIEGRVTTNWKQALSQLAVAYPDRMNRYL